MQRSRRLRKECAGVVNAEPDQLHISPLGRHDQALAITKQNTGDTRVEIDRISHEWSPR